MQPQFEAAVEAGVRILVYNGDTDLACNFLLGQRFVQELKLEVNKSFNAFAHCSQ